MYTGRTLDCVACASPDRAAGFFTEPLTVSVGLLMHIIIDMDKLECHPDPIWSEAKHTQLPSWRSIFSELQNALTSSVLGW